MSTRQEAEKLIAKLRQSNGAISDKARRVLEEENCREDLDAIQSVRRKLGASTRTLATNLYSKDTRFIYELIQNADDNSYSQAAKSGKKPFLVFTLTNASIIIDSNEDGFRPKDVEAICSTGESTKKASGYIGEKGIGFKSVFKVARKVHIQSGNFSFAFEYDNDNEDDGLGMVTPVLQPFSELPSNVTTRMTLTLLESCRFMDNVKELRALPDTLLLFLKQLRVLNLQIVHPDGHTDDFGYERIELKATNTEFIHKHSRNDDGEAELVRNKYLVIRRTIHDLPADSARRNISTAEVVLAFPVNTSDIPIVKSQQVFAYLPLRPVGFKFLIQSDFVTQASREDVFHSPRNRALLEGAAQTFRDAVLQFLKHETLQYQWMRYLPDDSVTDEFWSGLFPTLQKLLQYTPVLRSWTSHNLHMPGRLGYLHGNARDATDEPLFKDLSSEGYLAKEYGYDDFLQLKRLGCFAVSLEELLPRLEADLKLSDSRMKTNVDDDWHSRAAKLLSKCFQQGKHIDRWKAKLKSLDMIPLSNESTGSRWANTSTISIYFPSCGCCDVPDDLGLSLVQKSAIVNEHRRKLFELLGVRNCEPPTVIDAIYRKHRRGGSMGLDNVVHHMQYLYCYLPEDTMELDQSMTVAVTEDRRIIRVRPTLMSSRVYFNDPDDNYGAVQLFGNHPGFSVSTLHPKHNGKPPFRRNGLNWKQWLQSVAHIRKLPPPCEDSGSLSREFVYLLNHHPKKFFHLLQEHWHFYEEHFSAFQKDLKEHKVCSRGGELLRIDQAYFPCQELIELAPGLALSDDIFLPLCDEKSGADMHGWSFLKQFGVRFTDDLEFYSIALRKLRLEPLICDKDKVFRVYAGFKKNAITEDACKDIRSILHGDKVYIPSEDDNAARWVSLSDCRWSGPDWLETKHCLGSYGEYKELAHIFTVNLKVMNASHHDFLDELESMKKNGTQNVSKVSLICHDLRRHFEKDQSPNWLRNEFERRSLVYVPRQKSWYPPSKCVWADERLDVLERASISNSFPSLESFFCKMLGISKPSVQMRVASLKQLAKDQNFAGIKQEMMVISNMNPSDEDLKTLKKTNMFPVRVGDGDPKHTNAEVDWVIIDRKEFKSVFHGQSICTLDYSMDEVYRIRRLLEAMNLETRYMSRAVEETTMVEDGTLSPEKTNTMRMKAYALYRCAKHFKSPKLESDASGLFDILTTLDIYESDKISKSIQLVQSGQTFTVQGSRSNIHFEEHDNTLRIYIPADERNREVCYFQQLPREMLKYFEVFDKSAESVLKSVIGASILAAVDDILADEGIIEVDGVQRPTTPEPRERSVGSQQPGSSSAASEAWTTLTPPSPLERHNRQRSPDVFVFGAAQSARATLFTRPEFVPEPSLSVFYAAIIDHVINASMISTIPNHGAIFQNLYGTDSAHRFRDLRFPTQLERDICVGAAGELFVYQMLSDYQLPNFGLQNWRSSIRHRVNVHSRYRDLTSWQRRETSDIVYEDDAMKLTSLLCDHGYIAMEDVAPNPTYYIEVKTTTGGCDEVFYVSNNQYQMMQRMHISPGEKASEIMIIARVFNIDRQNVGMKLFLDPETHRQNRTLNFSADKWCVRAVC